MSILFFSNILFGLTIAAETNHLYLSMSLKIKADIN
jgi:hypothetical protein